jgi:transposase
MGLSRRKFTREFKVEAVRRLDMGVPVAQLARALEVNPNVLHRWRREQEQGPGNSFPGNGKRRWPEGRISELERKVGRQALEIDFLRDCLQRVEEQRRLQALNGRPLFTKRSKDAKRARNQGKQGN